MGDILCTECVMGAAQQNWIFLCCPTVVWCAVIPHSDLVSANTLFFVNEFLFCHFQMGKPKFICIYMWFQSHMSVKRRMQEWNLSPKVITGLTFLWCLLLRNSTFWSITYKHTIVNITVMTALRLPSTAANQNTFGRDTDFGNKHF